VELLYVEYLGQRYPRASIWIKGQFDPIAFVVAGELRAAVMPVKLATNLDGRDTCSHT
jgi:hypothetical protein